MQLRLSIFVALAIAAILSLLAGCGGQDDPAPEDSDDSPAGGKRPDSGGSGGRDSGSRSDARVDGGGPSGASDSGRSDARVDGGRPTAGAADSGSTVPATFDTVQLVITQAPCSGAGCHNDDQNPLDLQVDDELYARLTSHMSENCGNIPVVNPGKPEQSALVKILKGPCSPTPRMPIGCVDDEGATCVPDEYITAISQWIAMGAPQD